MGVKGLSEKLKKDGPKLIWIYMYSNNAGSETK